MYALQQGTSGSVADAPGAECRVAVSCKAVAYSDVAHKGVASRLTSAPTEDQTVNTMESARTRLADLAELSGVSTATVSRVLNRKPGVAESTRQAVFHAVDMLGYERPTRLPEQTAGLVGLIIPELVNPVFPAFAQSIETALANHSFTPLLCTQTSSGVSEDEYLETLVAAGVSGIMFVNGLHADSEAPLTRYEKLQDQGVPYVLVNGHREELNVPSVSVDERFAMDLAVRHLVSLGHTRIGLAIGPQRLIPAQQKVDGFLTALQRHLGKASEDAVVHSLFTVEGGEAATRTMLGRGFTGIVCGSDLMAIGAIRAIMAADLSVPEDVSVVGFDDSLLMGFTQPPLTTIRQPVLGMSQAAVDLLRAAIDGDPNHPELRFAPELIVRGSTGAAPGR